MKEGRKAPAFRLPDASGETVRLDDFHGRTVVLYFFPKADTPGCTAQACGIRDRLADYEAALKAAGVRYEQHFYPNTEHGFNNDTTPRFDAAAAKLAWERTVAHFEKYLKSGSGRAFAKPVQHLPILPDGVAALHRHQDAVAAVLHRQVQVAAHFGQIAERLELPLGSLRIDAEGSLPKFVPNVKEISFNGKLARERGQQIPADIGQIQLNDGEPEDVRYRVNRSVRQAAEAFLASLPIAGVDGTLRARLQSTKAAGNVRAKTGFVDKARSLSGYVTTAETVIAPRKLHSMQQIRTANYMLQTSDPSGINAAGKGSNVGQAVVIRSRGVARGLVVAAALALVGGCGGSPAGRRSRSSSAFAAGA